MARPEKLTDDQKGYIYKLLTVKLKMTADDVIAKVKEYLINKHSESDMKDMTRDDIEKIVTDEELSPSAITKYVTEIKDILKNPSDLDNPWSMATLDKHPISIEAIPIVLKVWKLCIEQEQSFTIREAKWVDRLSGVIGFSSEEELKKLSHTAYRYANLELMYQILRRPFNSMLLDKAIMHIPFEETGADGLLFLMAGHKDNINQIQELKGGKRDTINLTWEYELKKEVHNNNERSHSPEREEEE